MFRLLSAATLMLTLQFTTAHAQRDSDWVLLGEQSVGFRVSHDVFNIGQPEDWFRNRTFRALHVVPERLDIHILYVRIVYLNGFTEDLRVDEIVRKGDTLRINLGGERSYLKRVELIYRSRPDFEGEALIKLYVEPWRRAGGTPGRDNWAELGCQQVALVGRDRDVIRVGRSEGRFRAIRLYVRDADVEVLDLRVIYASGQPDNISVQNLIRAGERTRSLDLRGRERSIDRVELTYRTALNPASIIAQQGLRAATVCVEGLQSG